jgi:hypothetical protein
MEVWITGVVLHAPGWLFERGPGRHVGFHVKLGVVIYPVVATGHLADFCEKNIRAGKTVIIFGRIQNDEVLAEDIQIL